MDEFVQDLKTQLWPELEAEPEMFYDKLSAISGDVVEDWDFWTWTREVRMGGCKPRGTKGCHTTGR